MEQFFRMWCIPLLLLVCVALHHRWRIMRHRQDSWKGGGFSMFSEVGRNSLITEIWIQNGGVQPAPLQVLDQMEHHLLHAAKTIPTEKHLLAWVRWVSNAEWKRCGEFAHLPFARQDSDSFEIAKVQVRHRRLDFNCNTGIYSAIELAIYSPPPKGREPRVSQ